MPARQTPEREAPRAILSLPPYGFFSPPARPGVRYARAFGFYYTCSEGCFKILRFLLMIS